MLTRRSLLSLLAVPAGASTLATDGTFLLNGKRHFPLGLYERPKQGLRPAKDAGFDIIHAAAKRQALDELAAHGLHGWCTVGSNPNNIRATVAALRTHPSLLFWETEDEPSYQWKKPGIPRVSAQRIREAYALLKHLDPARPVYLNHAPTNLISTLQSYNPGGDIIATDVYPVIPHGIRTQYALWPDGRQGDFLNTHISQVGHYADKMRQVAGPRRGMWMVLQAFAWEMARSDARDPKMILYPTADQLLFMACQSIVHGANGLLWWGLHITPLEAPLWQDLAGVAKLLRSLDDLAAPPAAPQLKLDYHDTGHSLDRGIEWILKGRTWIAVNADSNPVELTIAGLPREVQVIAGPKPEFTPAGWRAKFAPFGTSIWRTGK